MIRRRIISNVVDSPFSDFSGDLLGENHLTVSQDGIGGPTRHFHGAAEAVAFAITKSDQREEIKELLWSKYGILAYRRYSPRR